MFSLFINFINSMLSYISSLLFTFRTYHITIFHIQKMKRENQKSVLIVDFINVNVVSYSVKPYLPLISAPS